MNEKTELSSFLENGIAHESEKNVFHEIHPGMIPMTSPHYTIQTLSWNQSAKYWCLKTECMCLWLRHTAWLFATLWLQPASLPLYPCADSPGKTNGVGYISFQGVILTQRSSLPHLHWQVDPYYWASWGTEKANKSRRGSYRNLSLTCMGNEGVTNFLNGKGDFFRRICIVGLSLSILPGSFCDHSHKNNDSTWLWKYTLREDWASLNINFTKFCVKMHNK